MGKVNEDQTISIAQLATLTANFRNMASNIQEIKDDIKELKGQYVTKDEFQPIRNLVYGFVVLVLVAVVGAIVALVVQKPGPVTVTTTTAAQK